MHCGIPSAHAARSDVIFAVKKPVAAGDGAGSRSREAAAATGGNRDGERKAVRAPAGQRTGRLALRRGGISALRGVAAAAGSPKKSGKRKRLRGDKKQKVCKRGGDGESSWQEWMKEAH